MQNRSRLHKAVNFILAWNYKLLKDMKKNYTIILVLMLLLAGWVSPIAAFSQNANEKNYQWGISVRNVASGDVVIDTLTVDLLRPDSTLIFSQPLNILYSDKGLPVNAAYFYQAGTDFIVRLSHPDYETAWHKVHIDADREEKVLQIRKLTQHEKAKMLDEVVVTASVVEFVHKGDTIQYNADAFELAEGSMLSALIKRLPGAELRDNGQIFVNGRFVDKLLLDGKDFFQNDKLVLLQNLPAYTVKNIKVYEQTLPQQLARKGNSQPDLVMDVKLKKDFNAGWLANAEAGGGTHNRYRLRGFGLLYNSRSRYAAHALINNLNETGSPDMSGEWQNRSNQRNEIITKGGGFDYTIEPKEDLNFHGSASMQYQTVFGNSLVNQQNYLPDGINYTRRWNDTHLSYLQVNTDHTASFKLAPNTWNNLDASFNYGSDKSRDNTTEGTFGSMPGDYPSMRHDLQRFMPDTLDILNRYLSMMNTDAKHANGGVKFSSYTNFGKQRSLSVNAWGNLSHQWQDGNQQYLLQYAGSDAQNTNRVNPQNRHGYNYGANVYFRKSYGWWSIQPEYELKNSYSYSNTMFYDLVESSVASAESRLPGFVDPELTNRLSALNSVLDAENSYFYGLHALSQKFQVEFAYDKKFLAQNGNRHGLFQVRLKPSVRRLNRKMNFAGFNPQILKRNNWLPAVDFYMEYFKHYKNRIDFQYKFETMEPQMIDMLNSSFNSDPMNPTVGNPDLKHTRLHSFEAKYSSETWFWNKLYIYATAKYFLEQNSVTYGYSYDLATGIRTTRPANINGNRHGEFNLFLSFKPLRNKSFEIRNTAFFAPYRFATYVSTDERPGLQRSITHYDYWYEALTVQYQTNKFTVAAEGTYVSRHNVSRTGDFEPYTERMLVCGARGLVRLPWNLEISTNINVWKRYGYTESSFNDAQVIWNARISKSIMHGSLQFAIDGYDMLQQCKRISFANNAHYRRETRFNSVPSYFMFTVKYFFAKKPRQ